MLARHLLFALRRLRRERGFALLNVAGLALGLAACLVIGLYVYGEWRYDRFHAHAERIVQVVTEQRGEPTRRFAVNPANRAAELVRAVPGVERGVTLARREGTVRAGDAAFPDETVLIADTSFFQVFSFDLHRGDPAAALAAPNTVVLTERAARRYFGDADPVGATITLGDEPGAAPLRVTGVCADVPAASHLQFDAVQSFASIAADGASMSRPMYWTYLLLREGTRPASLHDALDAYTARTYGAEARGQLALDLVPLVDLHLRSDAEFGPHVGGSAGAVTVLAAIAVLVLLLAAVNFTNLAVAAAAGRAREVGVRKALGAARSGIAGGFLVEAVVLVAGAAVVALGLVQLARPAFTAFTGRALDVGILFSPAGLAGLAVGVLLLGALAGGYPALVLARFGPVRALRGRGGARGGAGFRRVLVVFQFAVTIGLLAAALVAFRQLDYVYSKDLGFDRAHLVSVPVPAAAAAERLAEAWAAVPGVEGVTADSRGGEGGAARRVIGRAGADTADVWVNFFYAADADYADVLGLAITHGRGFDAARAADAEGGVLVNAAAARALGFADPAEAVGAALAFGPNRWHVVGVTSDFHFKSLHEPVEPLLVEWRPGAARRLLVRLRPDGARDALAAMAPAWRAAVPEAPFAPVWVDELLAALYAGDAVMGRLFAVFALLAVAVAALGLFGLAAHAAASRTKEIGVRKVLGAGVGDVVLLLVREFAGLVAVAFVVATPLAYLGVERWLDGFAYRVDAGVGVFALAGVGALAVALAVSGARAFRAASADPVHVLRSE